MQVCLSETWTRVRENRVDLNGKGSLKTDHIFDMISFLFLKIQYVCVDVCVCNRKNIDQGVNERCFFSLAIFSTFYNKTQLHLKYKK